MSGAETDLFGLFFLAGGVIFLNVLLKPRLSSLGIPSLLVFLLFGILLSWTDGIWTWRTDTIDEGLHVLSQLGVVALLFRVGLDSHLPELIDKLKQATWIWAANVLVALGAGFGTAYYLLGYGGIPSLITAAAFSATSVGVTASVWEEADQLDTPAGQLFVDVAELDDLSAVCLMALVFAVLPELRAGSGIDGIALLTQLGGFLFRFALFGAGCVFFSLYLEKPIVEFASRTESGSERLLCMVGLSFVIAALAGLMGFSLAIGALFAGLVFSRDPQAVREEARFQILYDFFTPFFFLVIGLNVSPDLSALPAGAAILLFLMAAGSKLIGAGGPAWWIEGRRAGLLLGISMIPRAEILLIIMKKGLDLGSWAVPEPLYGAMVFVSMSTCVIGAFLLRRTFAVSTE